MSCLVEKVVLPLLEGKEQQPVRTASEFTDGDNFGRFELVLLRLIWLQNSRHKRNNLEK